MSRSAVQRALRCGALIMAGVVAAAAISSDADARSRRHHRVHHRVSHHSSYDPAYASIVVDVNSGDVMQETNADSPRHPASLTKMMTLYLLFERLEAGKIKLSSELEVSEHASEQAPSKLGLRPGQSIEVEDAIKAIVTKSANDIAVVVAEALGGSERDFARLMTAKARELGMMHTNYHNASGLPDEAQITTARDQSILARALQDRFPKYFHYFSTRNFVYRGKAMRNHNHLLDRVVGVDGIKTGYIRESGFNIVTSVHRGNRRIVAVVFGGRTAGWRDARVRSLIEGNIAEASVKRTAPLVVERWEGKGKLAAAPAPAAAALVHIPVPAAAPPAAALAQLGSTAPVKPHAVKTVTVMVAPNANHGAMLTPPPVESHTLAPPAAAKSAHIATASIKKADPTPLPPAKPALPTIELAAAGKTVPIPSEPAARPRGPYMIQVGALDDEGDAKDRLAAAHNKARHELGEAVGFTEKIAKGDSTLYRARFAGLAKTQAEAACRHLKRSEIPCFLLKN